MITDIYSSKAFRAAKRAIDIKYTKAERAALNANIGGTKEYLVKLKEAYIKDIKALYNDPTAVKELAPKKKAAPTAKKVAPAKKKKPGKKKPEAGDDVLDQDIA